MTNYIIRLLACGAAVYFSPQFLDGIKLDSSNPYYTAVIVAFVMSLLNTFVKPVLNFLSIPVTILTLGLFLLVINVAIVYICAYFVNGFKVTGFLSPLIFGFILSIINSILSSKQDES
jgi:putative membrane protein